MAIVKGKKEKGSLARHFEKLKTDLSTMTFKEKLDHIWTYYKTHMLTALCVLMVFGGLLYGLVAPKPTIHIGGVQCNMELSMEGYDYLTSQFQQDVLGQKKGKSNLNTFWFYGEYTVDALTDTYKAQNSVTAYIENKQLDYMLVDIYSFRYFAGDRIFMDLRELLSAQELAQLDAQGMILYEEAEGNDEKVPRGINIVNTSFIQENSNAAECYLMFIRNTPRKENCIKLWNHIKNYKGEE